MTTASYAHLENTLAARIFAIPDLVKDVAALTDVNAHTESLLQIAKFFGMKEHAAIFTSLLSLHNRDHHMNHDIRDIRFATAHDMWTRIEKVYSLELLQPIKEAL